jgi:hypothetical protein
VGGGLERLSMTGLFSEAPESEGRVPLAPWLVGLAVAVLLAEVVVRRFLSGPRLRRAVAPSTTAAVAVPGMAAPSSPLVGTSAAVGASEGGTPPAPTSGEAPARDEPAKERGVDSALEAARERARRRMGQ